MPGSTISTTVTDTVLLGGATYPSPLTITGAGVVEPAAYGATGVLADAAGVRLLNEGQVSGGSSDYYGNTGGIGVDLRSGNDFLSNTGTIEGGGNLRTSPDTFPFGDGANGVDITAGKIVNAGLILGGSGGYSYVYGPGAGGNGVSLDASSLSNSGTIVGGDPGGGFVYVGSGVDLTSSTSSLHNTGMIKGGGGGGNFESGYGYTGGIGVNMALGGTLLNAGTILGGPGGNGYGDGAESGYGGTGLALGAGSAVNHGDIVGGKGGRYGGGGGAGVVLDGGTLTNFGTISGGGYGTDSFIGTEGDAVQFGYLAATLIVHAGAAFDGLVAAAADAADTLRLAGAAGTLTGLGTQFTGFSDITENLGATWTLTGANTLDTGAGLRALGDLTIAGTLTGGALLIGTTADLSVTGSLGLDKIHFAAGGGGTLSIGAAASVTGTLTGFASGDLIDVAKIATTFTIHGGTLILENGSSAVETLTLAGAYTAANFNLAPDMHGGTDITFVPDAATASVSRLPESADRETGVFASFHSHS